jgi:transposase
MNYSQAFKAKMVEKMLPPTSMSATALAAKCGVLQPTLSRWLREACNVPKMNQTTKKQGFTPAEKLRVLTEAGRLSDAELGEYLRRNGLHEATLKQWRKDAEDGLRDARRSNAKESKEKKRIKELERELRRKEKALAEASAILVLKKKVAEIWGDEDDDMSEENEP